jgi:predicted nucleic acid-binding protein
VSIGIDTSIVIRLLVGEPIAQARIARARLERALEERETVLVCDLVIGEAYFALHHHYGVPKEEARQLLLEFVTSGVVEADPPEAVHALAKSRGAGLVDRLVHARHRSRGAITLTFERKQAALEGAERLG